MEASVLSGSYRPGHQGAGQNPGTGLQRTRGMSSGDPTGWLPVWRSLGSGTDEGLAMSVDSHAVTALRFDIEAALVEPDD